MPAQHKNDAEAHQPRSQFDLEKLSKILSLIAIPIIIAIFGWVIQNRLSDRSLSQEYVKLAVSILEKPSESPPGLRDWAVDLLNQNSPTKFGAETIRQLKTGEISLSAILPEVLASSNNAGGIAVSPDEKSIATGQGDGTVVIWNMQSGVRLANLMGHTDAVTAVVYSPDAKRLFSGSWDNTIIAWDLATHRELLKIKENSPIVGLVVSPDGRFLLSRSLDQTVRVWDIQSGRLEREFQLRTSKNPTPP
jgi:WD40 repeat protein